MLTELVDVNLVESELPVVILGVAENCANFPRFAVSVTHLLECIGPFGSKTEVVTRPSIERSIVVPLARAPARN